VTFTPTRAVQGKATMNKFNKSNKSNVKNFATKAGNRTRDLIRVKDAS